MRTINRPHATRDSAQMPLLETYRSDLYGPLFAVSDEGSAGPAVVDAAYASAKARALGWADPLTLGVALDGERMTSAGEVPIGPDEYDALTDVALGRLLCTTNVGVRVNARLSQPLPEVPLGDPSDARWLEPIVAIFAPFVRTPNRRPRPLTIRVVVPVGADLTPLRAATAAVDHARSEGTVGPPAVHRLSTLIVFPHAVQQDGDIDQIERLIHASADAGIREVAVDAALLPASRLRLGIQSLLNVLDPEHLRRLLHIAAGRGVRLTYRYQLDVESAARTIWTGLNTARSQGFTAGKYGLVPMMFEEQRTAIELLTRWCKGWTAIPAFYVDTPLVTDDDIYNTARCADAALRWLKMARGAGASVALFDSPDRIKPRKLVRERIGDHGVLTFDEIAAINAYARDLGVSVLWSGGITSRQAFELARRKVFGIFSTSSTATRVAVSAQFESDPQLSAENEPTELGVRRIHAIVQGGFLSTAVRERRPDSPAVAMQIERLALRLLDAENDPRLQAPALEALDAALTDAWPLIAPAAAPHSEPPSISVPVPADAVRVFRGRRADAVTASEFVYKLATVFMPTTVQLQRLYGVSAYLPAVLPASAAGETPDEVALVFYTTQEAYHSAKRSVGGRLYSELHDLIFDMGRSGSGFPRLFVSTVIFDQPYHLFETSVDWQNGHVHIYVGRRKPEVAPELFTKRIAEVAMAIKDSPRSLDGVIFCVESEFVVWWEHAGHGSAMVADFSDITHASFSAPARRLRIPGQLTMPYAGLQLDAGGDFLNFQFERC